jgi:outer membrane protein OmpU
MNNLKKIGLSALAGSLVATSAYAGAVSVSGGASIGMEHINGGAADSGKSMYMGNQLTFTGGGELDNGLNVSISFILDQNDDATSSYATKNDNAGTPFDSHSITISSDSLGTFKFAGEGGVSASRAVDTTAAGDIFDLFDDAGAITPGQAAATDNMWAYTLPSLVDGLSATVSQDPAGSGTTSSTAYNLIYTGFEGLTLSYGSGEGSSPTADVDVTTYSANYAYGPVTVGYSKHDYDHTTATEDIETTSYKVSYTVTDEISVTYGQEEISKVGLQDADYTSLSASYTSGGMTISATMAEADNIDGTTTATEDRELWALGASFAF